jgi:hypothetical protein
MTRQAKREHQVRLLASGLVLFVLSCAPEPPPGADGGVTTCCEGRGTCLPTVFVEDQYLQVLGAEGCSAGAVCVPEQVRNLGVPPLCRASLSGGEGRCLPACLPEVQERGSQLRVDGCAPEQRCVPCYDPISGGSTRACDLGDDPGPSEAPTTFAACCGGIGQCVPEAALSEQQRRGLGRLSCDEHALCVPKAALRAPADYKPATCTAAAFGAEGRCLPACLAALAPGAEGLAQDGCEGGHVCAPCFDPRSGASTGACQLGTDSGPKQPPVILPTCCQGAGHCLPSTLIPEAQRAQLGRDSCSASSALCAPDAFTEPGFRPPVCTVSAYGAEGRCLPSCLPRIAEQLSRLARDGCQEGNVCAPCFDPLTGSPTPSCAQGGDPGPSRPPVVFGTCCDSRARCVPDALVPAAQRAQLEQASCAGAQELCVPSAIASVANFVPATCMVSAFRVEGRCLSTCLPDVARRAEQLREDGCGQAHACVPCYDPVNGESTGACSFGNDGSAGPPVLLATCCGGLGRCAPRVLVPAEQASALGPDSCDPGADLLCVAPDEALENPAFVPRACEDPTTHAEGRCLPGCLPAVQRRAEFLQRAACDAGYLCAPCFDPVSGADTGACAVGGDPGPSKPAVTFATCCGSETQQASGVCVPRALMPDNAPDLPAQSCTGTEQSCVPKGLVADPAVPLPACTSLATGKGVCVEECYLDSLAQTVSLVGSCAAGQRCVSCAFLGAGVGGC